MNDTVWLFLVGVVLFYLFTKKSGKAAAAPAVTQEVATGVWSMADEMARVRESAGGGYFNSVDGPGPTDY